MSVEALRRWARGHTREKRYSPVGITYHWLAAALVVFQLGWGWRIGHMPAGAEKLEAYELHVSFGLAILLLTMLRMTWRIIVPGPHNDADKPGWQSAAAHATHYTFYVCLVGLPLSGWAMLSSTAPHQPLTLFGAPWPFLPFQDLAPQTLWTIEAVSEWVHFGLVMVLAVLIPAHAGAALYHHFIRRHDVLEAMAPGLTRLEKTLTEPPQRPKRRRSRPASAAG